MLFHLFLLSLPLLVVGDISLADVNPTRFDGPSLAVTITPTETFPVPWPFVDSLPDTTLTAYALTTTAATTTYAIANCVNLASGGMQCPDAPDDAASQTPDGNMMRMTAVPSSSGASTAWYGAQFAYLDVATPVSGTASCALAFETEAATEKDGKGEEGEATATRKEVTRTQAKCSYSIAADPSSGFEWTGPNVRFNWTDQGKDPLRAEIAVGEMTGSGVRAVSGPGVLVVAALVVGMPVWGLGWV